MDTLKGILVLVIIIVLAVACYVAGAVLGWAMALISIVASVLGIFLFLGILLWQGIRELLGLDKQDTRE